jgi:dephospho-CoA kinase
LSTSLLRVALTGGIATGKSYCLARFAALGAPTIDADTLARDAVQPGTPGLTAVVARFGATVLNPAGTLDRGAVGRIVFADPAARRDLEAIVHPIVYDAIERRLGELTGAAFAIVDIPLLYETGRDPQFDRVVVAWCSPSLQLERLKTRGLSEAEARLRLASQWPIDEKKLRADLVIDTSGSTDETDRQVRQIATALAGTSPQGPQG